jgi:CMP-N-acetylneuraminic acid synthetase
VLVYSIQAALESQVFTDVLVSTEDQRTGDIAEAAGARWIWRSPALAQDHTADIAWIRDLLSRLAVRPESFAILRPTSPFRTAETIRRAYRLFTLPDGTHDSLRAVEPVRQHPGKMWEWAGPGHPITPLLRGARSDGVPWHSCPTQTLPRIWVQNSSLEMAYTANVEAHGTIHGRKVLPFFTEGIEGFTLDEPDDWDRAEQLVATCAR